jgi:hypothetical protein
MSMDKMDDFLAALWRRIQAGMEPVWASTQNVWEQLRAQFKR